MVTSGALQAATACQDMGNGTRTVIAQALADVFGISPHTIEVRIGDSKEVVGPASSGSRSTTSLVPAVQDAAEQMQAHLVNVARQHFELTDAVAVQGGVAHADGFIPWSEVFAIAPPLSVIGKRRKDARRYQMPFPIKGLQIGSGSTWGVHVSEVEVDMRFGMIRVLRVWGGFAAGRIVVPPLARSQAHGGIIQGIGYAFYEERQQDPLTGIVLSTNLTDYRLPGIADMPEIQIYFYEEGFDYVPGGAVGLAELTTLAVAASIGNAVAHATGWRPRALPLRPDRVLAGMREGKQ